jgi:chaperone BCS1
VGITEAQLSSLFSKLPKRCIVLLEDIDSAGLRREGDPAPGDDASSTPSDTDGDAAGKNTRISKTPKNAAKEGNKKDSLSLISMSGLLNIIDGAASHEGRVLIMSTNYPEKLDEALIRPGRIDLQVRFTLATHAQIRDIFMRMYTIQPDEARAKQDKGQHEVVNPAVEILKSLSSETVTRDFDTEMITKMAEEFADQFSDETFSPAEIQGYLLMYKTDPVGALEKVGVWREKMLEAKRRGKKVVNT